MKILGLIKGLDVGGAETLCTTMALEGKRLGYSWEIAYLVPDESHFVRDLEAAHVPVHLLGTPSPADPRWLPALLRLVRSVRPDIVHIHSPYVGALCRPFLKGLPQASRPLIVTTEHNIPSAFHPLTRALDTVTLSLSDSVIAVADMVRDSLPRQVRPKTTTILHGIDSGDLRGRSNAHPDPPIPAAPSEGCFTVTTVANLRPEKNLSCLLEAAELVIKTRGDVRFLLVGSGPLYDDLVRMVHERGLGQHVHLLGFRSDVPAILAESDLFLLTSDGEGLPVAVMEALTLGVPCAVTSVGGLPELVDHGRNGLLAPPGSAPDVAANILEFLDEDAMRGSMSEAAAQGAAQWDIHVAAHRVHEHHETLLASRS